MNKILYALLALSALLSSCNNELEINAPWKDVTVVYGLLNQAEDTNWVRIHRGYLGNDGIYGGNNEADSLYYANLNVSIQEYDGNGNLVNTWPLSRDNSTQLDTGFFTTDGYRLYRLDQVINSSSTYTLVIDKPDGEGDQVTATTPVVGNFSISKPNGFQKISFGSNGQEFIWKSAKEARIYQAFLRFHYVEINAAQHSDSVHKFVDYKLETTIGTDLGGGDDIRKTVGYDAYYRNLYNTIGENPNVIRFFRGIDIYVTAGADDLATYISVSQPASGIVQDKPLFTNVTNGIGIFSSTGNAENLDIDLSIPSLDSLVRGIYTCELMFGKTSQQDTCFCAEPGKLICN